VSSAERFAEASASPHKDGSAPAMAETRENTSVFADRGDGTRVDISVSGRGGSPGCANYRQALASPHPGRTTHDLAATINPFCGPRQYVLAAFQL
jgi:hypothetical protein